MLTGKRFLLKRATLGIETLESDGEDENRQAVRVPAGEIILVVNGPRTDDKRMVDVEWIDKKLVLFYEDIQRRGEDLSAESARTESA